MYTPVKFINYCSIELHNIPFFEPLAHFCIAALFGISYSSPRKPNKPCKERVKKMLSFSLVARAASSGINFASFEY